MINHGRRIPWMGWALLLVSSLLASGCSKQSESATRERPGRQAAPVIIAKVDVQAEETRVEAVGTARALRSVSLYAASSGRVEAVDFSPGQKVSAGAVLLRLDAREQALAVDLAKLRVADAERRLARVQGMRSSGAVTAAEIDDARSALSAARIEQQQAEVALDDRILIAPFDGHIGMTEVDVGDRIDTDTLVATLDDRSALLVSFDVPEMLIGRLRPAAALTVAPWAASAAQVAGQIVDIDSRIDPLTRTFTVRARVENDADDLRPGMSFRVGLSLSGELYPIVPEIAVQWGGDGAYVWRVEDAQAFRVAVDIVQRRQGRVLIDAPLRSGSQVVLEGVQRLRDGMAVSYLEQPVADPAPVLDQGGR